VLRTSELIEGVQRAFQSPSEVSDVLSSEKVLGANYSKSFNPLPRFPTC